MERAPVSGIVAVDKTAGRGSTAAVAAVKRMLRQPDLRPPKVGHAGTLDSFATGVLVVLIGSTTKKCEAVMAMPKGYEAEVRLGASTETLDPQSPEVVTAPPPVPQSLAAVRAALEPMVGVVQQVPPVYSALKVGGRRSADRARAGEVLTPRPRTVRIDALEVLEYDWPTLRLRVACGRGTYVRAIARDLGAALGTGGYLTALRRTFVGPFTAASAVTLERLEAEGVGRHLIDPADVFGTDG